MLEMYTVASVAALNWSMFVIRPDIQQVITAVAADEPGYMGYWPYTI